jgi:fatty acid-binding protein DegV
MLGVYMTKSVIKELEKDSNVSKQDLQLLADSIFKRSSLQCLVTDVNFLINGGRLTGLKAFLAKTLDLKIIVGVNDAGGIDKLDQDRDIKKALDKI